MRRIDDFLIDDIFQPMVDALARVASCYAMAAFILTGSALSFAAFYFHEEAWVALAATTVWLPRYIVEAHRLDQDRPRCVLSNERVTRIYVRLWFLSAQVVLLPGTIYLVAATKGVWFAISEAAWLMVLVGLYLMACRRPPSEPAAYRWIVVRLVPRQAHKPQSLTPTLAPDTPCAYLPVMFMVSEREAALIRAAYEQGGELSATVELRRLFPGLADDENTTACARTILGWSPEPLARAVRPVRTRFF